jgi:cytochrome c oxidase assembly protein subunit 15
LSSRSHSLAGLIFLTALSGAFVAGLDAGLIYNEFPLMGGQLIPSDLYDPRLGLKNPFENPAFAQFTHRVLAISSVSAASALWLKYRHVTVIKRPLSVLLMVAWMQGSLGVLTLLSGVEIELASAHQAGSVTLLSVALYLVNRLKTLK